MSGGTLQLAIVFGLGFALGALYLATLWGVVQHLPRTRHPALWLLGSAFFRIGALLATIYLVMDGRWERLAACLLGFLLVRLVATRWVSSSAHKRSMASWS